LSFVLKNEGKSCCIPLCPCGCSVVQPFCYGTHQMKHSEIVLSGRYSEYNTLYDFILNFSECEGYSRAFTDSLQLSMKEAYVNAVKHGNAERDDLTVSCRFTAAANWLQVSIRDCGPGFNPDDLPNPADPVNRLTLSGRGVYIIRSIAEIIGLERNNDGSTLMLHYIPY